jgi:hypothetical protein
MQSRLVRVANRAGAWMGPRISLDPRRLMEQACLATGLEDFGRSGFEAGLGVLVDSWESEARFHLVGRLLARRELLRCLANRLQVEEYFRRNPETASVPVPDPVIVTGPPRSGTTLLHRLLAADPANRTLRAWELFAPAPRDFAPARGDDPRLAALARGMALRRKLLLSAAGRKAAKAAHHFEAGEPEECSPLLQDSFCTEIFALHGRADRYVGWLRGQDWTPAFGYHRKQIQILTAAQPASRLVLKHPPYLGHLDDLFRVYPNARVLWLHRDPLEVVASGCSLCATARAIRTDALDPGHIGASIVNGTLWRFGRGMRSRALAPDRFLDVWYRDLTRNPLAAVARIYKWLGFPLTAEAERAFMDYLQHNRKERSGLRHEYALEEFGLDAATLRPMFRDYCERFQLGSARAAVAPDAASAGPDGSPRDANDDA